MTDKEQEQTKYVVSLGFGCMRFPKANNRIILEKTKSLVDSFMKMGYTYFDTAYIYEGSEQILHEVLVDRYNRNCYHLASKLPLYLISQESPMIKFFETTLSRLGTHYLDAYLLHGLDDFWCDKAEDIRAFEFLVSLKKADIVKSIGFSFHGSPQKLDEVLSKHPEVDFVQLQINYADWFDPKIQSYKLYQTARTHGIPIIVMEPVKGGLLSNAGLPVFKRLTDVHPTWSIASWAMRFVNSLEGVSTVLSGMNDLAQLRDNTRVFKNNLTLNESEISILLETAEILRDMPRIDCTACGYCVKSCPQRIKIPIMIDLFNDFSIYNSLDNFLHMYNMYTEDGSTVTSCVHCKICENRCPQKINITEILQAISDIVCHHTDNTM